MNKGLKIALWVVGIAVVIWAIWYFTKPKKAVAGGASSTISNPLPSSSASSTPQGTAANSLA